MPERHITQHPNVGFTLVEMSIVLVIIGLLVGGILVARGLIKAAELRATLSQVNQITAAVNTFKLRYNALPGDLTIADVTAWGFVPTTPPSLGVRSIPSSRPRPGVTSDASTYETR